MKRIPLLLALIITAFSGVLVAQEARDRSSASDTSVVRELEVNGIKVLIKSRPGAPTVSAGIYIRGGVNNYSAENAGVEELMLQSMAEGSVKFPKAVMRRELSRMGSSVAGTTSFDFGVLAMASTNENFVRTWELFVEAALRPAFEAQSIETVRERLLTALRTQSTSPDGYLEMLVRRIAYQNHPYSRSPGNIDTVSRLTVDDVRAHHERVITSSQLLIVVVGDVDAEDIRKKVAEGFGRLPKGAFTRIPVQQLSFTKPSVDIAQRNVETTYVKGIFMAPALNDPDYYAMRVAISILQTLVYQEVRTLRNLSYAPNADMDNTLANTAYIYVTASDVNQAVSVMLNQISALKNAPMDEERFSGIPNFFLTTYYIDHETNAAQNGELAKYELLGRGWRDSEKFIQNISSVTPADVQRVAKKYMNNLRFVVVGNPQSLDKNVFLTH